jgi:hypothetical protein
VSDDALSLFSPTARFRGARVGLTNRLGLTAAALPFLQKPNSADWRQNSDFTMPLAFLVRAQREASPPDFQRTIYASPTNTQRRCSNYLVSAKISTPFTVVGATMEAMDWLFTNTTAGTFTALTSSDSKISRAGPRAATDSPEFFLPRLLAPAPRALRHGEFRKLRLTIIGKVAARALHWRAALLDAEAWCIAK